ncbi:Uma2 family endonuclease [sulfur-oxidizing endosymbiont of Gigantopelta aegis]|uniref:Uma2 family endonuclease n=1 Tax=sulfur-oxidizing endosymbiont of Gigantopelta aegis TaxID=2794934 RepID=UPI0018DD82E1|nr:Uma2 family endonuclease [sulfur-oxidizing endosymbiont of Gigantopelta aegis]
MSFAREFEQQLTEDDYIEGELLSDVKHEYIDGAVYAMVGASTKHDLITGNLFYELKNKLKQNKSSYHTFTSDMKVKVSRKSTRYFYPDVMVVGAFNQEDEKDEKENDYYQTKPEIIFEVLSDSTEKYDKSEKRLSYFDIPSLKEYVLVKQNKCEVIVFERDNNWQSNYYFLGDEIKFGSINVTLSVENIYEQVNTEEQARYHEEQRLKKAKLKQSL